MDVKKFEEEFRRCASLFGTMSAETGCCKWPKNRGTLYDLAIKEIKIENVGENGYSNEAIYAAAFRATNSLAQSILNTKNVNGADQLMNIHGPKAVSWLTQLNKHAVETIRTFDR